MTEQQKQPEQAQKKEPKTTGKGAEVPIKKAPRPKKVAQKQGAGRNIALLALLVALGSGGGSYYLWQELQKTNRQLARFGDAIMVGLEDQVADNRQRMTALEGSSGQAISDLTGRQQALEQAVAALRSSLGQRQDDWSLAEVEYLLALANQRLQLAGDTGTAIAALETAARHLTASADPALLPVREQIVAELQALRGTQRADIESIALELSALIGTIETLPFASTGYSSVNKTKPVAQETTSGNKLQALGKSIWASLKSLVTIRHGAEAIRPLTTPEQRIYLRQHLQLKLESARLALLEKNGVVYRSALQEAAALIKAYYDTSQEAVGSRLQTIQHLATIDIAPPLPDISGSLRLLREQRRSTNSATGMGGTP